MNFFGRNNKQNKTHTSNSGEIFSLSRISLYPNLLSTKISYLLPLRTQIYYRISLYPNLLSLGN